MRRPNILFLLPDQLRHDFTGYSGAGFLRTPALDALAARGTVFETAISPVPLCVPARASMLTGLPATATGVMDNLSWLRPDRGAIGISTWPEDLSAVGYHTAAIGKMHFFPWDAPEGFAHRVIAEDKRHIHIRDDYHDALRTAGLRKRHAREQDGYLETKGAALNDWPDLLQPDRWVADRAAEALRAMPNDRPFALMVGFPGPHCPYDPPPGAIAAIDPDRLPRPLPPTQESQTHRAAFLASYKRPWAGLDYSDLTTDEALVIRRHYAALVERLDHDVATILTALEDTGRADNTLIVFASDHGDYLGDFGLVGKTTFHEPSIRVPLLVAGPRWSPARRSDPVSLLDVPATIRAAAGVPPAARAPGRDLAAPPDPDRVITGGSTVGLMARSAQAKLVRYANGCEALFDLLRDPCEQDPQEADGPQRRALDAALARDLLDGLAVAHAPQHVAAAKSGADDAFHARGWVRPYPARLDTTP